MWWVVLARTASRAARRRRGRASREGGRVGEREEREGPKRKHTRRGARPRCRATGGPGEQDDGGCETGVGRRREIQQCLGRRVRRGRARIASSSCRRLQRRVLQITHTHKLLGSLGGSPGAAGLGGRHSTGHHPLKPLPAGAGTWARRRWRGRRGAGGTRSAGTSRIRQGKGCRIKAGPAVFLVYFWTATTCNCRGRAFVYCCSSQMKYC